VNSGALIFGILAITDMVWPRSPSDPWYLNYGMILTSAVAIGCGIAYLAIAKPYERGDAPAGDAHLLGRPDADARIQGSLFEPLELDDN
jgi:hypothetical protein